MSKISSTETDSLKPLAPLLLCVFSKGESFEACERHKRASIGLLDLEGHLPLPATVTRGGEGQGTDPLDT